MGITKEANAAIRAYCMEVLSSDQIVFKYISGVKVMCSFEQHYSEKEQRFLRKCLLRAMLECIDEMGYDIEGYLAEKRRKESGAAV